MRQRESREAGLRAAIGKDPQLQKAYGGAWQRLEELLEKRQQVERCFSLAEEGAAFSTRLFSFARALVRLADETTKPDAERLYGYNEARLADLKRWLFAEISIDPPLEIRKLTDSLTSFEKALGGKDDLVVMVLAGKRPAERAEELVRGSRLGDAGVRRALADGGSCAVAKSNDPMIDLARLVDEPSRLVRGVFCDDIGEQIRAERFRVAAAMRAVAGPDAYPDATGTLRLSFGRITNIDLGTQECPIFRITNIDPGTPEYPIFSTLTSLFWSLQERPPVAPAQIHSALEPRSIRVHRPLKFDTPFVFETDADGTFGNSGSPVLNRQGRQIGVLSRGPYQAMSCTYEYDQRHHGGAIHMAGVVEVLLNVYGALELVGELTEADENPGSLARSKGGTP